MQIPHFCDFTRKKSKEFAIEGKMKQIKLEVQNWAINRKKNGRLYFTGNFYLVFYEF